MILKDEYNRLSVHLQLGPVKTTERYIQDIFKKLVIT